MNHEFILALIIVGVGSLAGLSNYLVYYFKDPPPKKYEFWKYLLSSIGASALVPLLLNMLSSNLIKRSADYDTLNYFVFAGFCFIAGYFSDRFINSIGDKILKDIETTKDKVNTALREVKKTDEKVDLLVSNETESEIEEDSLSNINLEELVPKTQFTDDDIKTQVDKIVQSFNEKYTFRTHTGIGKELQYPANLVKLILEGLEKVGATKRLVRNDGTEIWALTNIGRLMVNHQK